MAKYVKSDKNFIYEQNFKKSTIKSFAVLCMKIWYRILFLFIRKNSVSKKYKVSICGIFKDEEPYLKEWIEFNRIVGVDHFYLYNNNSSDGYMEILDDYIKKDLVTLVDWPYQQAQMEAYKDCIKKYSDETEWIGFIDIDEFIVPKTKDSIYEVLKGFKNRGSVIIYWKMFGTSGFEKRDITRPVTEDFVSCWPKYCGTGKIFYNTRFGFNFDSERTKTMHHRMWTRWHGIELPPVNLFDKICIGSFSAVGKKDVSAQINHYCIKSVEEYSMKRRRGDVYYKVNPHGDEYFERNEILCDSVDYSAHAWLDELKKALYM